MQRVKRRTYNLKQKLMWRSLLSAFICLMYIGIALAVGFCVLGLMAMGANYMIGLFV